jgi:hypothetical protein
MKFSYADPPYIGQAMAKMLAEFKGLYGGAR